MSSVVLAISSSSSNGKLDKGLPVKANYDTPVGLLALRLSCSKHSAVSVQARLTGQAAEDIRKAHVQPVAVQEEEGYSYCSLIAMVLALDSWTEGEAVNADLDTSKEALLVLAQE